MCGDDAGWERFISLKLPGEGVAMGRPRFNRYTGGARLPSKTRRYLQLVSSIAEKASWGMDVPITRDTPIRLTITAVYKRPQTKFRKKDPEGRIMKTTKSDLDNLIKSIGDGLDGLWTDDAQVAEIRATKWIGAIKGERKDRTSELPFVQVDVDVWDAAS